MQVQSAGQTQFAQQSQQLQVRKMDGSGNGQGNRNGSNCTSAPVAGSAQQVTGLPANISFSTFA